ncbi:hypothetical protein A8926_1937 [Saccharopolyspora spinosa]|uniref:Uncharacterized protein n=1 Tax=Saccharopolyspora spinosa TaxID=60894 RepID=A0A2N3XUK6_SACSN|nr:hypothetical protein A8926_1937 [Saccharopolyspora spinosa]
MPKYASDYPGPDRQGVCKVDLSGLGSFGREGGWQVGQVGNRLSRWWTVSIPAAVPFGRRQRHIRFAGFRPEQGPSRLRALARPYPPTISIEIAEVVHRHRRVGMRHADGPQVPLKSNLRFQWNLRVLSAGADSMNVFAPGVTASTARAGSNPYRIPRPPPPEPARDRPHAPARTRLWGWAGQAQPESGKPRTQEPGSWIDRHGLDNPMISHRKPRPRLASHLDKNPPQPSDQPCTRPAQTAIAEYRRAGQDLKQEIVDLKVPETIPSSSVDTEGWDVRKRS